MAYSPLGRGFLTGQITSPDDFREGDFRGTSPGSPATTSHNIELVDTVRCTGRPKGCTPGQLALAWVLSRGDDVVPIPGTKRRTYLEENVAAARRGAERRGLAPSRRYFRREQVRAIAIPTWGRWGSRRRGLYRRGSADEAGPDRPGRRFASGTDAQPEVGVRGVVPDRL